MKQSVSTSSPVGKRIGHVSTGQCLRTEVIATNLRPRCILCGYLGTPLYEALTDELFGAPGNWGIRRCANPECGLIWLDPAPLESELSKAYYNYYTHFRSDLIGRVAAGGWLRDRLNGLYGHLVHYSGLLERRRRMLIRHLDCLEPGRLLEIGCGDGSFLSAARERGWEVTGVDSDPQAAQVAIEKHGIAVHVGRFEDCDFPIGHFDLIVMNHVIEHLLDPVKLLGTCATILRMEGRVLLVTPNSEGLGHTVFGRRWRGLEPPRHFHLFSPGTMEKAIQRAGLGCVYLKTTSVNAEVIFWGSLGLGDSCALMPNTRPLHLVFLSWLYQYYALARNLWNRMGGEEIVMVCKRVAKSR